MNNLSVKHLSIKYRYGAMAISDLSFDAVDKSIICVYGEEESGKTSLLKCLAGLLDKVDGEIIIPLLPDGKRDVTLLFEDGSFFENKSVKYNLEYPLKIRKTTQVDTTFTVTKVAQKLNLNEDFLQSKVRTLDEEDRVILSFARALMRKSSVYLVDEPFKNLPQDARRRLFAKFLPIINEWAAESIVIFATSSIEECVDLNTYTLLLNYGICIQQGYPSEIGDNPNCLLAMQKFNGFYSINYGKITKDNDELFLLFNDKKILLNQKKLLSDLYVDTDVIVGQTESKEFIFDKSSERLIYFS